jgi:hypothetical protein
VERAVSGPEDQAARWDARYAAAEGGLFGDRPNDYLRMIAARGDFRAETALMLADGDGRNSTWLAREGLTVTAVDLSAEATARAKARDRRAGVAVRRITADLAEWAPAPGRNWQAATILYLHGPEALRLRALETAAGALAPGGWLVVEGFSTAQAAGEIGPDDPDKLYDPQWLFGWAEARLSIVEALAGRVRLDEGARHAGLAEVVRLAARRA